MRAGILRHALLVAIHELFPQADTAEFEGTVTISSVGGQIAATAIELGSAPGEFTTFPVAPLP